MENNTMVAPATNTPLEGITQIHDHLRELYSETTNGVTDPATQALMSYNGYYSLEGHGTPSGAFFSVDTNMVITNSGSPVFHISLVVSLNGTQSHIFDFTGSSATFDKETATLTWKQPAGSTVFLPDINITFHREDNAAGVTATFTGTITLGGQPPFDGTGTTYNNIIPCSMYEGKYHDTQSLGNPLVMEILPNYGLSYLDLFGKGSPTQVDSYIYNMNMYVFSFQRKNALNETFTMRLIMGTSSSGGMVCNNLTQENAKNSGPIPRNLQTILKTKEMAPKLNENSQELMQYAGFYRISSTQQGALASGAFISVEGIYTVKSGGTEYKVEVGISTDGISSKTYIIDTTMSFENDTLTIPAFNYNTGDLTIKFDRGYVADGNYGTLVSISGTVGDIPFTGSTRLNPVPLSAFGGAEMKSTDGTESLTIHSDSEITYNGITKNELIYVPLMYIVAFEAEAPGNEVVLSLGTDGGKGNTCIVTDHTKQHVIDVVYAIPEGQSGQATPPMN